MCDVNTFGGEGRFTGRLGYEKLQVVLRGSDESIEVPQGLKSSFFEVSDVGAEAPTP